MPGASISRWTMSYFAASLAFLVLGQALLAGGFGYPILAIEAPGTLIIVHILSIGWLALLFCGALLQFVPVLVAKPLAYPDLAAPALLLLITGLALLCCGFLALSGHVEHGLEFLPVGATLLTIGFGLIIAMIGGTLARTRPLPLSAKFVGVGLLSLLATAGLGLAFAFQLSGLLDSGMLHALIPSGVSLHAFFAIVGWMSFSAFGVSYRLLSMFLLAPEGERGTSRVALMLLASSIAGAMGLVAALAVGIDTSGNVQFLLLLAAGAGVGFGYDVLTIYRGRKRRALELNSITSALAVAYLMLAILLYISLLIGGQLEERIGALIYLTGFGWLSMLGLGQLYKIVPFMTWLECYGPILGRKPVPRVQELVCETQAAPWFQLYAAAVAVAVAALLLEATMFFQGAVVGQLVAVVGLVVEIVRTRRLSYISPDQHGVDLRRKSPLFLPNPIERSRPI